MESFEYAVIRIVPSVEREEFINAGVVLFCKSKRYLGIEVFLNKELLQSLCSKADIILIKNYLNGFVSVANGSNKKSPIASLDIASRFRWLTAVRSTILQTSRVHTGLTDNPEVALQKIFREQVERG
ncbi:hypothetical protein A9P82_10175 [Arachidicoccus ginsenosidimutans]|uniref:DUF3037 domain-containing protein n=1 Tax=Arachidicoccus sp. BS20 TaxID=1850526 RepID=UPI0007F0505A|nr:DUF3037 domain-containing protein [Arachidicoccus sp. BS20]ANI89621.1 hypothetical protein A9P82_10175 [Arachidicoccus sp. BS20]